MAASIRARSGRVRSPGVGAPRLGASVAAGSEALDLTDPPPAARAESAVRLRVAIPEPPARTPLGAAEPMRPPPLELALTDLAEVFGVYPYRASMPACTHCVSDHDLRALGQAPGHIAEDLLARYMTKAVITWGDAVDMKRLLPEILTRLCDGRLSTPEALVGARLRRAGWVDWPAAETPAVRRTLRAAWQITLATAPGPGRVPASQRLALIASAETELAPYLDLWEDRLEAAGDPDARLAAVLHLADLLAPLADGGRRNLARAFPLARRSVVSQLDQWLRQPLVIRRLAHAADALSSTPQGPVVDRARKGLARLRTDG